MLFVQPILVPSANPLGLKGPSRFRWSMQPKCRQISVTLRAVVTGERPTVDDLSERDQGAAGAAEEDERGQQHDSKSVQLVEEGKKREAQSVKERKRPAEVGKVAASRLQSKRMHSEETKEKMRQAHLNKRHTIVTRIKISKSRSGQKHSEETRRKMSLARKQYWDNWHREKMSLQAAEPSNADADLEPDSMGESGVKVPRPKRKAWYRQSKESRAAEE